MSKPLLLREKTPPTYNAMQFIGGSKSAKLIIKWLATLEYKGSWKKGSPSTDDERIIIKFNYMCLETDNVYVNDWVLAINDDTSYVSVCSPKMLEEQYEKVKNA